MGTLTTTDILSEVRFALKNRPDDTTNGLSDDRLLRFCNYTYLQMCHPSVHRHRELFYTFTIGLVSGTNTYVFSPVSGVTITAIRSVTFVDAAAPTATSRRSKLRPHDMQWFDERTITSGSDPTDYAIDGNTVVIAGVPGTNQVTKRLQLRTIREPELLALGDTTVLTSLWDEVLVLGTKWRAENYLGYRDLAEATKLDFAALLNEYANFDDLHGREEWDWTSEFRTDPAQMGGIT